MRFIDEIRFEAKEGVGSVILKMVKDGKFSIFKYEIESAVDNIDNFPNRLKPPVYTQLCTKKKDFISFSIR